MSLKGLGSNRQLLRGKINNLDVLALSAYDVAVKNGYQGTEEEWLLSLKGGVHVDDTLKIDGVAADSKATGDGIRANATAINEVKTSLANVPSLINEHVADKNNPHAVTKKQVGLDKVDNTADKDKPVSTAQATAIADAKKAGTDAYAAANNAQTTANEAHTAIAEHKEDKNNPHAVTCTQIGAVNKNGDTMTGTLTLNGMMLTEDVDYGATLPEAGTKGRLFFKKV